VNDPRVTGIYSLTHRVRWRIFGLLFTFGAVAYFQQKGLTVAAERIMPELSLTQMEIGWLEWAFVLGYTLFQFPGGLIGQRVGARIMFTVISSVAFIATVLTPLSPVILHGTLLFVALFGLQLVCGLAQGAIFPVSSGVMESWFPPRNWALVQGLQSSGLQISAALTVPLVAYLMNSFGWQRALLWPALPAAAVIVVWAWYGRNRPQDHPSVTAPELAELDSSLKDSGVAGSRSPLSVILTNRSILLLSLSYVCMNYVFYLISNWCFLYLVQERHFTVLEGGVLGILPPLAAAVGAGVGGKLVALACERWGTRIGFRVVPMTALPAAGLLLLWAVQMSNAYLALIVLSLAYCVVEFTEGAFWGGIMFIGRKDSMVAGGVLNTGGNLGGLIGIPIVGYLSSGGHWTLAFVVGAGFALISALLWLGIDTDKSAYETA
jgi:MFS transporter, ACS family, glucarate transporter